MLRYYGCKCACGRGPYKPPRVQDKYYPWFEAYTEDGTRIEINDKFMLTLERLQEKLQDVQLSGMD